MRERIGVLPELPAPTSDPAELIEAYEQWITRYLDIAGGALADWINKCAQEESDERVLGVESQWWLRQIQWRVGDGPPRTCVIDGRKDLPLFRRARGAWQAVEVAREDGDEPGLEHR